MHLRRKKLSASEMRSEIVRLIDENQQTIYKMVYYSIPEVKDILEKLIDRWESKGKEGAPIDYASTEELEVLYKVAEKIAKKRPDELLIEYRDYIIPRYE